MSNVFDTNMITPTFIFVDGSYYNFYRYFALLQWWKCAYPDEPIENPFLNIKFVEKFKKTHVENLQKIHKKLKLGKEIKPIFIIGKDCKREEIWRIKHFPEYKANRVNEDFMVGPFFKMVYEENLFQQGGAKAILKHPNLEADDCIALSVKYLLNKYSINCQIYIITSDFDYLQLKAPNVNIFNLAYKNIAENKRSTGKPNIDLQIKIIMGDSSDNIPSVFPKCGIKTAQKYIDNHELFQKKLHENSKYIKQYELNQLLVDFTNIPQDLQEEFISSIRNP